MLVLDTVISGGQTGADIAGLIAAKKFGYKTGGWMPNGFLTTSGPHPDWAEKFGLKEHSSSKYPPRTYANAHDSDATIRLAFDFNTAGEACTLKAIQQSKKPYMDVDLDNPCPPQMVVDFLDRFNVKVLNIAGNSERTYDGTAGEVIEYLTNVFNLIEELKQKEVVE